jgi:hypothetical protein
MAKKKKTNRRRDKRKRKQKQLREARQQSLERKSQNEKDSFKRCMFPGHTPIHLVALNSLAALSSS